jgi:hypothetical protein
LAQGGLTLGHSDAVGLGLFTIEGGVLDASMPGIVLGGGVPVRIAGDFAFTGTLDLETGTGAVTLAGGSRTVTVNGSNLVLSGSVGDGGAGYGLTKAGVGGLTLSGAN